MVGHTRDDPYAVRGEGAVFGVNQPRRELRNDLRLLRHAMKKGWPITAEMMARSVERVFSIIDEDPDDKLVMDAVKTLVVMHKHNTDAEQDSDYNRANVIETTSGNLEDQRSELLRRITEARDRSRDAGADGSGVVVDVTARIE